MEKETFKVLTQHGKEVGVKQHAVQPRKTRAVALDCHQVDKYTCTCTCTCIYIVHVCTFTCAVCVEL